MVLIKINIVINKIKKIVRIKQIEILIGGNNKFWSLKFISFSLLIGILSYLKWFITTVLTKGCNIVNKMR